jgi:chromosome segregation ATPase
MTFALEMLFKLTLDAVALLGGRAFTILAIFRGETACDIELIARMTELVKIVEEGGEDCIQRLHDLAAKVEAAEAELAAAGDAAEGAMGHVAEQAPTVTARADAVDTDAVEKKGEVDKELAAATTLLEDETSGAREDSGRALEAAEALAALLSTRIEETRRSMGELRQAVQQAGADLAAAAQRFQEAAAEVDRTCTADAVRYRAGIDALMQEGATHLTSLANKKVEAHNGTLGPLRQRMTVDEPRDLHETMAAVAVSMQQIIRLCDERDDQLVQSAEKCEPLAEQGSSTLGTLVKLTEYVVTI